VVSGSLAYAYATAMADALEAYLGRPTVELNSSDLPTLEIIVEYVAAALVGISAAGVLINAGMYINANYASLRAGVSELLATLSAGFSLGGVV
jgi:hypothetical protein